MTAAHHEEDWRVIDVLTDPQIWLVILFLGVVGSLARLANYYAGQRGKEKIETIYTQVRPETWENVLGYYRRMGPLPLLVASIPFIGTALTIGAGMAGIGRNSFILWVMVSKVIRNWILVLIIWNLL
jgi:membrane protein YqaA with SNARE-associated domain